MQTLEKFKDLVASIHPGIDHENSLMRQLSSIELVDLVASMEERYHIVFSPMDIDEKTFASTKVLHDVVVQKAGAKQ